MAVKVGDFGLARYRPTQATPLSPAVAEDENRPFFPFGKNCNNCLLSYFFVCFIIDILNQYKRGSSFCHFLRFSKITCQTLTITRLIHSLDAIRDNLMTDN